jgi:hypothetical protein
MNDKLYAQTVYLFKKINVEKKFSQFTFTELKWNEVSIVYCNKQEILRIDGEYYMFSGEITNNWVTRRPPVIRFKHRSKIIKEIQA